MARPRPVSTPRAIRQRPPVERPHGSREFVDLALGQLRARGYRPAAWARFLAASSRRAWDEMLAHPRAALEATALHALLALPPGGRPRAAAAWLLTITHLGLLGRSGASLGLANALSLLRAGLPVGRWSAPIAMASDAADGWLARRRGGTAFGAFADPLADAAFWTAVAFRPGSGRLARSAVLCLWLAPAGAIAVAYFVRGQAVDYPRPLVWRRASVLVQSLLALDLLLHPGGAQVWSASR